jgi:hypothetical protein
VDGLFAAGRQPAGIRRMPGSFVKPESMPVASSSTTHDEPIRGSIYLRCSFRCTRARNLL